MAEMTTNGTNDRATRLAMLLAEAAREEAEADGAVSPEDAEEHAAIERIEAARARKRETLATKRRAELSQKVDEYKRAANGAYVVDSIDVEETAEGAGCYVIRSPSKETWRVFREMVDAANGNTAKVDAAYVNLTAKSILWPEHSAEEWLSMRERFPVIVQTIGDAAGRLGGVASNNRKR